MVGGEDACFLMPLWFSNLTQNPEKNNISHPKLGHVSTVQPVHVCDLSTVQATRHLMKTEASLSN